jgi:hypothetical protein
MRLIKDSVRRALTPAGGLKALTPLEIASKPVSDDPPLANALSSTKIAAQEKIASCWLVTGNCPATSVAYCGRSPRISRPIPRRITSDMRKKKK